MPEEKNENRTLLRFTVGITYEGQELGPKPEFENDTAEVDEFWTNHFLKQGCAVKVEPEKPAKPPKDADK